MSSAAAPTTSPSLLGRLRLDPNNAAAWAEFTQRYGAILLCWCRRHGLQAADAEDICQEVLLSLSRAFVKFTYDPSRRFRGYLYRAVRRKIGDFVQRRRLDRAGGGDAGLAALAQEPAQLDLQERLAEEFDQELLAEAFARVRLRVKSKPWQAFVLLSVQGVPGGEVARELGYSISSVYRVADRVKRSVAKMVARLQKRGLGHGGLPDGRSPG